jgi:hypothetical protein
MTSCIYPVYPETCAAIRAAAIKTNEGFPAVAGEEDGRLDSAVKEKAWLTVFIKNLPEKYIIEIPKARYWYDIKVNGIPINLKLTTGRADNAFNKKAVEATMACGGNLCTNQNSDYNDLYSNLKKCVKNGRNIPTEYHYLVVNKNTREILFKAILDIHTYKTNPSNIMQINWKNEFKEIAYKSSDFKAKIRELMKVIQSSLKQWYERSKIFIEADIDKDFA